MDDVISRQGLRVALVRIADQRTDSTPGGQNVSATDFNVLVQIILDLRDDELNLVLGRSGRVRDVAQGVGRAGDGLTLPRQEENDSSVRSRGIQETHLFGTVITRQDNVHTRTRSTDRLHRGIVHLADRVCERTRRIDHALGVDCPRFVGEGVLEKTKFQLENIYQNHNAILTMTLAPQHTSLPVLSFFLSSSVTLM